MDRTSFKVMEEIRKTGMLKDGDRVLAGVSGGADSVFLFFALLGAAETMELTLKVVHVHHGIRGSDADADAAFVEALCCRYGVACRVVRRDVPREAAEGGLTLEEAGRNARLAVFREEAERMGGAKIALAHHRDDLAETVLFRAARGTGIRGLAAMRPISGDSGEWIRPMLGITRREIEESLAGRGISWRTDATNEERDAARNRIRHDILPALKAYVNSGAGEHLARLAERAAEADDFIRSEAEKRAAAYLSGNGSRICVRSGILQEPAVIRAALLSMAAERAAEEVLEKAAKVTGTPVRDLSFVHIAALEGLFGKAGSASLDLPGGLRAARTAEGIELFKGAREIAERKERAESAENWRVTVERAAVPELPVPEKRYTKWIDYDKIKDTLVIRTRREGDFLTIDAAGHRKKLSDYFTDSKVPRSERERIALVADGSEIVWVVGMRLGYRFRVGPETKRVLKLQAEKERVNE